MTASIYLLTQSIGVCVGGRFDRYMMHKHHDGQWVSVRKLDVTDPMEGVPEFLRPAPKPQRPAGEKP